jgi:ectoine hydroxylase-related dioxygenase (phytanoyl-CoA dioxygenase family)
MPGFPGNFRDWHQDSEYSDPQSNDRHVTVIVYLDDMDGESGATWVVPGTHRLGPLPHVTPKESLTSAAREVDDKERYAPRGISFDFKAGDALVFLVRLIHKSGPNLSDSSRWSVALNYARRDTLDLRKINHFVGAYLPIVRGGRLYVPGAGRVARH